MQSLTETSLIMIMFKYGKTNQTQYLSGIEFSKQSFLNWQRKMVDIKTMTPA